MLQIARVSPKLLGDSRDLVESFVRSQINPDGAFCDRAGNSDLYYTVFGLDCLVALQAEPPLEAAGHYLREFGDGNELDFVHLACLARCWAAVTRDWSAVPVQPILGRIEAFRTADGGYNQSAGALHGSAYGAYLALGAYQDLGMCVPEPDRLLGSLQCLRAKD